MRSSCPAVMMLVGARVGIRDAGLIPQLEILYMALSIVRFPATGGKRNNIIRARSSECIRAVQGCERTGGRRIVGEGRQRAESKNRRACVGASPSIIWARSE